MIISFIFSFFTRRDWLWWSIRFRFYYLTCLNFNVELFLFVIFSTFSFVLVQLFFIYWLSLRSLRNHYLTLLLFSMFFWIRTFNKLFYKNELLNMNLYQLTKINWIISLSSFQTKKSYMIRVDSKNINSTCKNDVNFLHCT
jgi:hypothetical protein